MFLDLHHLIRAPHFSAKPLSALFFSFTIRTFAVSLVSVFIPLYILKVSGDFLYVLYYLAYFSVFVILLSIPLGWLVNRIGFKLSVFLSSLFMTLYFLVLIKLEGNFSYLYLVSLLEAIKLLLFWIPFHLIFLEDGNKEHFGAQVSIPGVLGRLTAVAAPLLGGYLATHFGFSTLFNLGLVLAFLSFLPILALPSHQHQPFPPWRHILKQTFQPVYRRVFVAFWGVRSVVLVAGIVWPVFLFFLAGESYQDLGLISSGVLLVSALTYLVLGKYTDKHQGNGLLGVGAWVNSFIWIAKAFVVTPLGAFVVDSLNKFVDGIHSIPFDVLTYEKALAKKHPGEFIIRREVFLHLGGLLTTLLMILLWVLGAPLPALFAFASLGYLFSVLLATP